MSSRLRRYARRGLLFFVGLLLIGGVLLVVPPFRRATFEPAARAGLVRGLDALLGGSSSVDRLAWKSGGFELENLVWRAAEGPARIRVDWARVDAALWRLARMDLGGIERVVVRGVDIVWVVEPSDAEPAAQTTEGPPAPFSLKLPALPEVEARDVSVEVVGPGWGVELDEFEATLQRRDGQRELMARAPLLRVTGGARSFVDGALELDAAFADRRWDVERLRVGDDLELTAALREKRAGGFVATATARLEAARAELQADWTEEALRGGLTLAPLELDSLPSVFGVPAGLEGTLDLVADWDWGAERPWRQAAVDVDASVVAAKLGGVELERAALALDSKRGVWTAALTAVDVVPAAGVPPLAVDAALAWSGNTVRLERALVSADADSRLAAAGEIPFTLGEGAPDADTPLELTIDGEVADLADWPMGELRGRATLTANLEGTFAAPRAALALDVQDAQWGSYPGGIVQLEASAAEFVSLNVLRVDLPGFANVDATGRWDVETSLAAWTADSPPEWRTAPLTGNLELAVPDLARVSLASETLRRIGGNLSAVVALDGSIEEPAYVATASLTGGRVDFLGDLPSLTNLMLELRAEPGVARIVEGRGASGGGPFTISGEYDYSSDPPVVQAVLAGDNLLFARSRAVLLRGDVDLAIDGPVEQLDVTGDLHVTNGILAFRFNVLDLLEGGTPSVAQEGISLFSLTTPPLSNLRFNIDVTAERPIAIENNVVTARVRPDVKLRGTGEVPELNGTIYVDDAAVSLPGSTLRVERGIVRFDPADPFVPELAFTARTKRLGYDISISVTGPYDEPVIELTSVPPLASEDILVLVLTGQLPADAGSRSGRSQAGQTVALYFGKDLLTKWFASDDPLSDEESFFERFEFVTGQEVSRQGVPTLDASFRLREDLWEDEDRLLLTLERDVWEDYNLGVRWVVRFK
ncbi:MAG: translocation/assembly module TamB domain-containing protein [Planctomycetota bacterium]